MTEKLYFDSVVFFFCNLDSQKLFVLTINDNKPLSFSLTAILFMVCIYGFWFLIMTVSIFL